MTLPPELRRRAFAQAITFDAFVERSSTHGPELRRTHDLTRFDAAENARIDAVDAHVEILAIVEEWCPDVVATLPIVARLAEASDRIELHVLVRGPATAEVADAYPHEGRSHIPTYVLFGDQGEELGVLVERTAEIAREVIAFRDAFLQEHGIARADFPARLSEETKALLLRQALDQRATLHDLERATLIRDLTEIAQRGALPATGGAVLAGRR